MGKFTSETGRLGGSKSRRGISNKSKQWANLADKFVGPYADAVIEYLDELLYGVMNEDGTWAKEPNKEKFMEEYKLLLNYFQPKQQATRIIADTSVQVNVVGDKGLIDSI